MKIIFDLRNVGLGNNGGSSTLVKSGNILHELGHNVYFIDSMKNQHTWTKLKAEHIVVKRENMIPDADIIIATGYKSVGKTVSAPERCGIKSHWIRAWEHWQYTNDQIINRVLNQPTIKFVNSICLQKKLQQYKVKSYIVRPGYDFELIYPLDIRTKNKYIILGGLYRAGVHGQRKRTNWIIETAKVLKDKHNNIKLWLFGSEKNPNINIVDKYLRSPSVDEKNLFYNSVNIWLAPTMSEGLHLPPAEAMMTKCPVVGTSAELSGTQDYLIHNQSGLVSDNNIQSFIDNVELLYKQKKKRNQYGENGYRIVHSIGSRKDNMWGFVELIEKLKS